MVAYVPNGYGYLIGYFKVDAWRQALQKMPDFSAKIMNFDYEKEFFEGECMVKRATGTDLESGLPLEWDNEGFCFYRTTNVRKSRYDLFWRLREVEHE